MNLHMMLEQEDKAMGLDEGGLCRGGDEDNSAPVEEFRPRYKVPAGACEFQGDPTLVDSLLH